MGPNHIRLIVRGGSGVKDGMGAGVKDGLGVGVKDELSTPCLNSDDEKTNLNLQTASDGLIPILQTDHELCSKVSHVVSM